MNSLCPRPCEPERSTLHAKRRRIVSPIHHELPTMQIFIDIGFLSQLPLSSPWPIDLLASSPVAFKYEGDVGETHRSGDQVRPVMANENGVQISWQDG
jgi:hypothetical protein